MKIFCLLLTKTRLNHLSKTFTIVVGCNIALTYTLDTTWFSKATTWTEIRQFGDNLSACLLISYHMLFRVVYSSAFVCFTTTTSTAMFTTIHHQLFLCLLTIFVVGLSDNQCVCHKTGNSKISIVAVKVVTKET